MGSISKITINYDKVRKTINEHYADLGRDVKVRIVHKQSPRGRNFYVFEGCEKNCKCVFDMYWYFGDVYS